MKSIHPQYITDDKGKKLSVVLSIKEYQNLLKELENIRHNIKEKEPTKKEILDGIKQGLKEVELHRQGQLKLKSAKDLLNEL
ncbi:hypothetical protein [Leptospira interrogans]|uniref:hypothetical protein n=1 Tax=Leptospira interrogans TaxID=173 RepID=UPI000772EF68|nr:hypothetical protein [Leptospira interrogans]